MQRFLATFRQSKIQTRLVVYYLAFAVATVGAMIYFAYSQTIRSLETTVGERLNLVVELKQGNLNQWLDQSRRDVEFLANLPEFQSQVAQLLDPGSSLQDRETVRHKIMSRLTDSVQSRTELQDIQIVDRNGQVVISTIPDLVGVSQSEQPFFIQGLNDTFTQTFYHSDLFGRTILTIATPLLDDSQRTLGVLAMHFNMRRVDQIFRAGQGSAGEPAKAYLVDSNHNLITDEPLILTQMTTLHSSAIDLALQGRQGSSSYVSHTGAEVIGTYLWMKELNAALIVEMDREAALQPAHRLAANIAVVGLQISIILIVAVLVMAERITAPLRALSETVSRVSQGQLNASAPVLADDEVGALARAFNSMTKKLRLTLDGLQNELIERKQVESDLLQFRTVMDESNDAIFLIDPETSRCIDFNKSAYEFLGYSREELGRMSMIDIAEYVTSLTDWHDRIDLIHETGSLIFETVYRRKNYTTFPVEISSRMLYYGSRTLLLFVARDITRRQQSERELRESEERFRKVFQSSPVAISITTLEEGRLLDANYAYWDLTGYVAEQALGRNARELKLWEDIRARAEFVEDLKRKGSLFNPDDHFYHTDGTLKYVISFHELIRIGHEDCVLSMFYDMSVQKQMMQALQESEARIHALVDAFPDMIMELSLEGVIINMVPPKGVEARMPTSRFIGKRIDEVFERSVVVQTLVAMQHVVAGDQIAIFEFEISMSDKIHAIEARLTASASDTFVVMIRDFTERKWAEKEREKLISELEVKNKESETLRESVAIVAATLEKSEAIDRILEQLERVVPFDSASVQLLNGKMLEIVSARGFELDSSMVEPGFEFMEDDPAYPVVYGNVPYVLYEDIRIPVPGFARPPYDRIRAWMAVPLKVKGRVLGVIALDGYRVGQFSERHAQLAVTYANQVAIALENAHLFSDLQAELSVRQKLISELENKNAELERFTYTVSHDLKSPLFTIRGFLGYLEQDALSGNRERLQGDIQRITNATDKMQRLLNELLELSRVGRLRNEPIYVNFSELASEALELVQGRIMEHKIDVKIQADLPQVYGDRPRLVEVLQNLLDNAAKFMGDQKQPRIEIGRDGEQEGMPIFYVRDNGVGIAPEHHDRVFGLFNKLDPKSDGTGVGLALVRRILEVHGGRVWIRSEAGQGCTFFFTLPTQPRPDSVI
ncbi:MAG TPA: PAS domain S-box protein [Anaerolineales bacterium]|nr:PAS domain S-box protein [Anaerolineales bacterium]